MKRRRSELIPDEQDNTSANPTLGKLSLGLQGSSRLQPVCDPNSKSRVSKLQRVGGPMQPVVSSCLCCRSGNVTLELMQYARHNLVAISRPQSFFSNLVRARFF